MYVTQSVCMTLLVEYALMVFVIDLLVKQIQVFNLCK